MHGRLATVTDRRQALRLRRLAFSLLMGGAAHTLVCWLILQWGFFRGGATVFYALFGTIWAGHLGLLLFLLVLIPTFAEQWWSRLWP